MKDVLTDFSKLRLEDVIEFSGPEGDVFDT
jgi:hypothetical protein